MNNQSRLSWDNRPFCGETRLDDLGNGVPGGLGGLIGGAVAAISAAIYGFRKFVRSDKVESAQTGAQVDLIETLQKALAIERERTDLERKRADEAFSARNELVSQIGELKAQIAVLQSQLDSMRKQLDGKLA